MVKLHNTNNLTATKVYLIDKKELESHPDNKLFSTLNFKAKYNQKCFLADKNQVYIGLDLENKTTSDPFYKLDFYELGATLGNIIEPTKILDLQLEKITTDYDNKSIVDFTLGFSQAIWKFTKFKEKKEEEINKSHRIFTAGSISKKLSQDDIEIFEALQSSIILTRETVDDTPENINPESIINIIQSNLQDYSNIDIKVFNDNELADHKMNSIRYVGRASRFEPTMVHVSYKPKSEVKNKICLVGKGVTYDSGGLDVKTSGHMKTMKCDMAGAATVFGVMSAIAKIGLEHTEVHWISPFVENMVSGEAYKADDIINSYSGQTIEVFNTDAEGRLTLADALSYATTLDPDYIIDFATLTGMCLYAVSEYYTAIMGNDTKLSTSLINSFQNEGEYAVLVDMPEVLREAIEGDISDVINTSKIKMAGHITAGLFLSNFIDQTKFRNPDLKIDNPKTYSWAHLDIAGSSYNEGSNKIGAKGSTGHNVRSMFRWLLENDR